MKRLRPRLSYANVVSTLCLFLLLGGGAAFAATQLPKNSVGPKQIRKGAITPAKLAPVTKQTFASVTGPQGPQGATGPQGPAGAAGATKVVVRVGKEEIDSEAFCKPGEVAVGGGGFAIGAKAMLFASEPIDANGETTAEGKAPQGWFAGAELSGGGPAPSVAHVVCASP